MAVWTLLKNTQDGSGRWLSIIEYTVNGDKIKSALNWNYQEPVPALISEKANAMAIRLQDEADRAKNVLNENDARIDEHYKDLLREIVAQIKADKTITLAGLKSAVNTKYPDNLFSFDSIIKRLRKRTGINTFSKFKTFVVNNKFEV